MTNGEHVNEAIQVLASIGLPPAQQNERSGLCLLALIDLTADKGWDRATDPLVGITPIMDWVREHYRKDYAPNTRETVRRQTMHQFVDAGIACYNPDDPHRPVNSPRAVYQIEPCALALLRTFGTDDWDVRLRAYAAERQTLVERYARQREQHLVPVQVPEGVEIRLSPASAR